jgi:hypothetical protein
LRQHPILAAPSTGSSQTRSSQRLREFDRDLEFIFGRKAAVQEVTSGQEAVDDTPHIAVDTAATAVDTAAAAAAAAVSQQTGDTAPKKPKRSRLVTELEWRITMVSYLRLTLFDSLSRLLFYLLGVGQVADCHPIRVSTSISVCFFSLYFSLPRHNPL